MFDTFEDTSGLGRVKSLYLSYCEKLKRLVGLENVPHIHLEVCKQLEDIDCLTTISHHRKLCEVKAVDR